MDSDPSSNEDLDEKIEEENESNPESHNSGSEPSDHKQDQTVFDNDMIDINKTPEHDNKQTSDQHEHSNSENDSRKGDPDVQAESSSSQEEEQDDDEEEEESEEEESPRKKPKKPSKEEQLELLRLAGEIRRSDRTSKTVQRYAPGKTDESDSPKRKRRRKRKDSNISSKNDSDEVSDDSGSCDYAPKRKRQPARRQAKRGRKKAKRVVGSSDSDDSFTQAQRIGRRGNKVNYKEKSSDSEINEDDVLEWGDEETEGTEPADIVDTIEKVIKNRMGKKGATGSQTTIYNCEDKGDPNTGAEEGELEQHYLIKWLNWAHIHNTWESEESLLLINVKGIKKLENYIQRMREIENWKSTMDRETIEYFDCEQEMNEQLYEQYTKAERIIVHNKVRDKNSSNDTESIDYLVKWMGMPYSEATWEDSTLIARWFQQNIDEYNARIDSNKMPSKSCPALRRRPKFTELSEQPEYLADGDETMQLRDYQLKGLNWLLYSWCKNNSVILADEMGLGKTIQVISYLDALVNRYDVYGPYLIVVPLSTMAAWQKEFQLWAPDLNVIVYLGDVSSREMIRQYEWCVFGTKRLRFNCVLTTFEILLKDKSFLGSVDWVVLGVDEAHRLKNDESLLYRALSEFRTDHRLLITGTPLQNSLKELWALLHFIMPHKYDSWEDFESEHKKQEKKGYSNLHAELKPLLLRRVKKQVEKSLPSKVEKILRVDMTAMQKQYYKWILTKNYKALSKGVKGSITGFINLVMELKKCCNHTFLTRAPDFEANSQKERLEQLVKGSGKLILLDKLLMRLKDTGHRVLIFSQMVMLLDILQEYLRLRRFTFQRLDGSIRGDLRKQALEHFNSPNSLDFCFLLSTRAGGLGINLATADTVIIFDSDWNPQNDLQAQSRAHRIGQTKQVNIYRLVTKSSVEEDIVERAKRKLVLDHLVIQRMDTTGRTVLSKNAVSTSTSAVPFDKNELSSILKFGAEDLFKEKDGDEMDPEVDIDDVLRSAETREADDESAAADFLNVEVTNFAFDEEEEIDYWVKVIPEEDRKKVDDEERAEQEAALFLPPRQRNKVQQMARNEDSDDDWKKKKKKDSDASSEDDSSDDERPRQRKGKKAELFSFTNHEIRRFVKSFRKFAQPLSRLEAIACDANLEEHSTAEMKQLAEALIKGCQQAANEYEQNNDDEAKKRDRGPVFKLGGIDVYVKPLVTVQASLEPLNCVMPEKKDDRHKFKLPGRPKPLRTWDVEWDERDDACLLRGVYEYGMGSWDSIKMDPDLGLTEKILLNDKVKKPQANHMQTRVEYLLKYLHKLQELGGLKAKKTKSKEDAHMDDIISAVVSSTHNDVLKKRPPKLPRTAKDQKVKDKDEKGPKRGRPAKLKLEDTETKEKDNVKEEKTKKPEKPTIQNKIESLVVKNKLGQELKDSSSDMFKQCVQEMRAVKKAMKKLSESESKEDKQHQLVKIGDHINSILLTKTASAKLLDKWHSCLWTFVSRFIENCEAQTLHSDYLVACKERPHDHHDGSQQKHHHHHHKEHLKEPQKDKEKDKSKIQDNQKPNTSEHDKTKHEVTSPGWKHSGYEEPRYQIKRPEDSYNQPANFVHQNGNSFSNAKYNRDRDRDRNRDREKDRYQDRDRHRYHTSDYSRKSGSDFVQRSEKLEHHHHRSRDLDRHDTKRGHERETSGDRGSWRPLPPAPPLPPSYHNRISARDPRHRPS